MVCPEPWGMRTRRSVFGFITNFWNALRSRKNAFTLFVHAAALGGAALFGQ